MAGGSPVSLPGGGCRPCPGDRVPGRPGWLAGRGGAGERGAWHNATPAVLGGEVWGRGLTLLLDGVKFMFFLWK